MLLADAVSVALRFVTNLYYVYLFLIFVYIILSWFRLPYSRVGSAIQRFLHDVVTPYLNVFRRFLPMLRLGGLGLDLSPIFAILALTAVWRLSVLVIEQLR